MTEKNYIGELLYTGINNKGEPAFGVVIEKKDPHYYVIYWIDLGTRSPYYQEKDVEMYLIRKPYVRR